MPYERKLILQFSLIGLGVTLVVATLLSYILQRILVEDALDVTTTIAGERAATPLRKAFAPEDLRGPFSQDTYRRVDEIVRRDVLRNDIVRVKIWSLDKKLLYSDTHLNIGMPSGPNRELDEALAGQMGRELSRLQKVENEPERQWESLLEVYVPLKVADANRILGAFEIYQTTDALDGRITRIKYTVRSGVFGGFAVLYLGLFGVVRGAARRLVARSIENERLASEVVSAYDQTIEGWATALELKDQETEGHSRRVTGLTVAIAREMGFTDGRLGDLRRGAVLHDIGKMGVPDAILKKPGPLDDEEFAIIKQHPEYSRRMLEPIGYLAAALDIPLFHHERWDGTGYPQGLAGAKIPLPARIFAVVDVWDALTHDRCYRQAWPVEKALEYLREQVGKHFDPAVVSAFLTVLDGTGRKGAAVAGDRMPKERANPSL
ncbi:MAG: HD-GYP domain-containing protein [Thermodesulfobacteriota bacterium]